MITELLTILRTVGSTLYNTFVLPGEFLLAKVVVHVPVLALWLGIDNGETPVSMTVLLSLLSWLLLIVAITMILRLGQNLAQILDAMGRRVLFNVALFSRNIKTRLVLTKTKLVLTLRRLLPRRALSSASAIPMVEFDDLDLAVLRSASAQGPGFALSAPELAEKFRLRPSQVQRSLEKLSHNKMLDYVLGSTDGFDNYRLTDSGAAFVAMWQRQETGA